MLDLAIAIPTLFGSICSMLATGSILVCYMILPPQRHYRHTLIINLATADFLNSTNNTASGIYAMIFRSIRPGIMCSVNGWLGQVTVQATDFSILFITIATVVIIRQRTDQTTPVLTFLDKLLVSFGIWLIPLLTSTTAFVLDDYKPVSGNWCWIDNKKPGLRYALAHGWRLGIIFTTIVLYASLFIHIHHHFSAQRQIEAMQSRNDISTREAEMALDNYMKDADGGGIYVYDEFVFMEERVDENGGVWDEESDLSGHQRGKQPDFFVFPSQTVVETTVSHNESRAASPPPSPYTAVRKGLETVAEGDEYREDRRPSYGSTLTTTSTTSTAVSKSLSPITNPCTQRTEISPLLRNPPTRDPLALVRRTPARPPRVPPLFSPQASITTTITASPTQAASIRSRERSLQKILLFNAYPIAYVLLWLSGLLNRFLELLGHQSRAVSIAQASTQFVGFANACVYGYNERIWSRVAERFRAGR